jgi:hypothetical protein
MIYKGLYVDPDRGLVAGCPPLCSNHASERTPAFLPQPRGTHIVSRALHNGKTCTPAVEGKPITDGRQNQEEQRKVSTYVLCCWFACKRELV